MALWLAFYEKYKSNIDDIDVAAFVKGYEVYWINVKVSVSAATQGCNHDVLSDKYLTYLLPLLEPVLGNLLRDYILMEQK